VIRSVTARIVLAYLALVVAADALLLWGAAAQARRMAEERALQQARDVTGLLVRQGFGGAMLERVKAVIGADVVEVLAGRVRGGTLPADEAEAAWRAAREGGAFAPSGRFRVAAVTDGDTTLVFAWEASKLEAAKAEAVRPLWLLAAGAFVGAVVLGVWLGTTLLRPVGQLLAGAERVKAGELSRDVPADSGDEFAVLAGAFNRMQAALRKRQEDERWAAAGRVAAGVAHDLRNPLTGVLMMAQMLERDETDGKRREALSRIVAEVKRLESSVAELMGLASPGEPKKERVDLGAVVREAAESFRARAEHRGVAMEIGGAAGATATADTLRVRRVLDNLLANALDATPAGGRIRLVVSAREGGGAEVTVSDTGAGLPESVSARLFEAFNSEKPGGTGLGLATAKRLVDVMSGEISVETGEGGTTFSVKLPSG
jgi:signal transduction histidine kinase